MLWASVRGKEVCHRRGGGREREDHRHSWKGKNSTSGISGRGGGRGGFLSKARMQNTDKIRREKLTTRGICDS